MQRLRELASRHGMLLVADEVQSGMGRTGKMFAMEHYGVRARHRRDRERDRIGHAARRVRRARRGDDWPPGAHASTFGGNPVSCAAAIATIALLKRRADARTRRRSAPI